MHTDEGPLRAEMSRAQRAQDILNDELVSKAIGDMREKVKADFFLCNSADAEQLRLIRMRGEVIDEFVNHLRTHIETGKLAADALQRAAAQRRPNNRKV